MTLGFILYALMVINQILHFDEVLEDVSYNLSEYNISEGEAKAVAILSIVFWPVVALLETLFTIMFYIINIFEDNNEK